MSSQPIQTDVDRLKLDLYLLMEDGRYNTPELKFVRDVAHAMLLDLNKTPAHHIQSQMMAWVEIISYVKQLRVLANTESTISVTPELANRN